MKSEYVVLLVSALLFVATEYFFPIDREDSTAKKQKHFLSIMLTILSLVMGYDIKMGYDLQERIENVGSVFKKLPDAHVEATFQDIFTEYNRNFAHAQPVLKGWAGDALNVLVTDMRAGYISIPREDAKREIGKVYQDARENILASNVGGTKFYFNNQIYIEANRIAFERGVPVIRFYLYSKEHKVELRSSKQLEIPTIEAFFAEVQALHKDLGTVYSAVIDISDIQGGRARDLLQLDNKFAAETELAENWEPIRAKATEDPTNLKTAREYFRDLLGAIDKRYVAKMEDAEIKKHFHKYEGTNDKDLAENIFKEVLKKATGN